MSAAIFQPTIGLVGVVNLLTSALTHIDETSELAVALRDGRFYL